MIKVFIRVNPGDLKGQLEAYDFLKGFCINCLYSRRDVKNNSHLIKSIDINYRGVLQLRTSVASSIKLGHTEVCLENSD